MGIIGWIVFGFFAGLIARALMPGEQKLGIIMTTLLGVGGAFAGGFIQSLVRGSDPRVLHPSGFIGAVIGSLALLLAARLFKNRS